MVNDGGGSNDVLDVVGMQTGGGGLTLCDSSQGVGACRISVFRSVDLHDGCRQDKKQ